VAGVLAGVVLAGALALWLLPPGSERESRLVLRAPFATTDYIGSHGATVELPRWWRWSPENPPPLTVYEDGKKLDPAMVKEAGASPEDAGRRWTASFLTSDRSDPNTNGRAYEVTYQRPRLPLAVSVGLPFITATAGLLLAMLLVERLLVHPPALRRIALTLLSLGYTVVLLESVGGALLADRLTATQLPVRQLYEQVFHIGSEGGAPGSSANFRSHHYLNFVLNPDAAYMGERQFDAHYLIRRKEPIRARAQVSWRALVLGGSTTFGEGIAREEDTWVYRLEQKLRAAHGQGYDVVDGGVPGYSVVENFLHYILLLDELEPDVVVLFVGLNDIPPRLTGDLARDYSNNRRPWRDDANTLPEANRWLSRSVVYRYLMLREVERRRFANIAYYVQRWSPPSGQKPALEHNGPDIYRAHLRNLVRLLLAQGHRVVIVPQVFLPSGFSFGDPTLYARGVAEHNQVNEDVAREFHVSFVSAASSAFDRSDLLDDCHFNQQGNEKMAQLLFAFLESQLQPVTDQ